VKRLIKKAQVTTRTALAVLIVSVVDATGTATLFKCVDSQGKVIFTDSPDQLLACHALEFTPTRQSSAASPARASAPSQSKQGSKSAESELTSSVDHDSEMAAVPVERLGNILVVSATFNGKQARLIVDTGASHTIISQRLALDLGLYSTAHLDRVSIHTAGGTVQADSVVLDSLRIAGAEVRNSHVLIHDLPDLPPAVDGLLGLSFLGAYQVTLDTTRGELVLKTSQAKVGSFSVPRDARD
jgi:clan AA aspartic protease (TIGR02281 family)